MKEEKTNEGRDGGLLKGDAHSAPSGGIKAVVTDDGNKPVLLEGMEVVINKKAVNAPGKKTLTGTNKEILHQINTSTGGKPIMKDGGEVGGKPESKRFTLKNNYGSFTSIFVYVNPKNPNEFMVQTTVRAKGSDGKERIQKKERWLPIDQYDAFISDMKERGAEPMRQGGNVSSSIREQWTRLKPDISNILRVIKDTKELKWFNRMDKTYKWDKPMANHARKQIDLLNEVRKGTKHEREHEDTLKKVYSHKITPEQGVKETATTHIKENPTYYEDLQQMEENKNTIFERIGDRPFPWEMSMYDYSSTSHVSGVNKYPYRLTNEMEAKMYEELGKKKYSLSQYELMLEYAKYKGWPVYDKNKMAEGGQIKSKSDYIKWKQDVYGNADTNYMIRQTANTYLPNQGDGVDYNKVVEVYNNILKSGIENDKRVAAEWAQQLVLTYQWMDPEWKDLKSIYSKNPVAAQMLIKDFEKFGIEVPESIKENMKFDKMEHGGPVETASIKECLIKDGDNENDYVVEGTKLFTNDHGHTETWEIISFTENGITVKHSPKSSLGISAGEKTITFDQLREDFGKNSIQISGINQGDTKCLNLCIKAIKQCFEKEEYAKGGSIDEWYTEEYWKNMPKKAAETQAEYWGNKKQMWHDGELKFTKKELSELRNVQVMINEFHPEYNHFLTNLKEKKRFGAGGEILKDEVSDEIKGWELVRDLSEREMKQKIQDHIDGLEVIKNEI